MSMLSLSMLFEITLGQYNKNKIKHRTNGCAKMQGKNVFIDVLLHYVDRNAHVKLWSWILFSMLSPDESSFLPTQLNPSPLKPC